MKKLILALTIMLCTVGAFAGSGWTSPNEDCLVSNGSYGKTFSCTPPRSSGLEGHVMYAEYNFGRLDIFEKYFDGSSKTYTYTDEGFDKGTYCYEKVWTSDKYEIQSTVVTKHKVPCELMKQKYRQYLMIYGL